MGSAALEGKAMEWPGGSVSVAKDCLKLTRRSDKKTVPRPSRQNMKHCYATTTGNVFWLIIGLLLCSPKYSTSSDDLQEPMHRHSGHAIVLEPFKALRAFRILTKINRIERLIPEQSVSTSTLQQAIHPNLFAEGKLLISDKDGRETSQTSEGGKGGLNCEGESLPKKFPSDTTIMTGAASGGATQASIPNPRGLFPHAPTTMDPSQTPLAQHVHPKFETQSPHPPSVAIEPSFLQWGEQPLYSPGIISLTIRNTCNSTVLNIFQLYSSVVQFYTSSFQKSTLSPGEQLQTEITYLPRTLGLAEAIMVLETSAGGFIIPAQGFGIASPYRLPSILTLSVEEGKLFKQNLTLYNPYDKELEVKGIRAWPVDPTNSKLHLLCGSSEGCGEIGSRVDRSCFERLADDDCSCNEVDVTPIGCCASSSSSGLETSIKLRRSENWKIEAHHSSQIAFIEVILLNNASWTAQFSVRLAHANLINGDDTIIIPIKILWQQPNNDMPQLESNIEIPDFVTPTPQNVHAQSAETNAVQLETQENLRDSNKHVFGLTDRSICSENHAPIERQGCKEFEKALIKEVHDSMRGEIEKQKLATENMNVSILVGAVSHEADMQRQYFKCHQLCHMPVGAMNDFCQTYRRLLHSNNCSNLPISSINDVGKKTNFQAFPKITSMEQSRSSWGGSFPKLMTLVRISHLSGALIEFPTVQVGRQTIQYIRVMNPNQWPISLQLLLYPHSEAIDCIYPNEVALGACLLEQSEQLIEPKVDISAPSCKQENNLHSSSIFSLYEDAVSHSILEAYGETVLGPILFRPPSSCVWSSLVILANNVSGMEWLSLQGRGGSAHLTLFEDDAPIQTITLPSDASHNPIWKFKVNLRRVLSNLQAIFGSANRRFHVLSAKNTGTAMLHIFSVGILNGSDSADGLDVLGPQQFSLKAGQSTELTIYYGLEQLTGATDIYLQIITSAGRMRFSLSVSSSSNPPRTNRYMELYTKNEMLILQFSVFALTFVLVCFSRLLIQEISQGKKLKSVSSNNGAQFSQNHKNQSLRTFSSSDMVMSPTIQAASDHTMQPSSPSLSQLKSVGGPHFDSGQDKQKGSLLSFKGMKALIAVIYSVAVIIGSVFYSAKSSSEYGVSPQQIHQVHVKSEAESASSEGKSSKEWVPASARRGAEKKPIAGRSENQVVSVAQSLGKGSTEAQTKQTRKSSQPLTSSGEKEKPSKSPNASSTKENHAQYRNPTAQLYFPDPEPAHSGFEKDKEKRKATRQLSRKVLKQEEKSKSKSVSSSSASSPASPVTPIGPPSRPISPLFQSELGSKFPRGRQNVGAVDSTLSKSLKNQPCSPLKHKHNSAFTNGLDILPGTSVKATEIPELTLPRNWDPSLTEPRQRAVGKKIKVRTDKVQDPPSPFDFKEVLESSFTVSECDRELNPGKESKAEPSLTTSATFPQSGREPWRKLSPLEEKIVKVPYTLLTDPLVEQAPGSKLSRSYYQHVFGTLYPVDGNGKLCDGQWLGYDLQGNCRRRGSASVDGSESSSSNPDGELDQVPSNLEYDIWGNHFAGISRPSAIQHRLTRSSNRGDRFVESSSNDTSSLFSTSSHLMLTENVNNQASMSNRLSEFSMFNGKSFSDISFVESSPRLNLPSTEDVTFASVENLQPTPIVVPQKRNRW